MDNVAKIKLRTSVMFFSVKILSNSPKTNIFPWNSHFSGQVCYFKHSSLKNIGNFGHLQNIF